jgi:hypothetical protein
MQVDVMTGFPLVRVRDFLATLQRLAPKMRGRSHLEKD